MDTLKTAEYSVLPSENDTYLWEKLKLLIAVGKKQHP
jgi:hypothetical protein